MPCLNTTTVGVPAQPVQQQKAFTSPSPAGVYPEDEIDKVCLCCCIISCTACNCGSLLLVLLALRAVTGTGYLVSWVTGRLVVSCLSCTKVDLQLYAQ
jgi:hypothetical protein